MVPSAARAGRLLERGGTLHLRRPDPGALPRPGLAEATAGSLLRRGPAYPLRRVPGERETRGLSEEDLYWLGPRSHDWRRPTPLAPGLCRAQLVPSLEAEGSQRLAGSAIERGAGQHASGEALTFHANGVARGLLRFAHAGRWLLGLLARGTPAGGGWPMAVVRLDGSHVATHRVGAADAALYASRVEIAAAGEHGLEVAFVNDLYEPPEDRNLTLEAVLWRPEERPPGARPLAEPACLARHDRGPGRVLLDWLEWDDESTHAPQAGRIGSTLLVNQSVQARPGGRTRLEAESMEVVDARCVNEREGFVWLGDAGALQRRVRFSSDGVYGFGLRAQGTPMAGGFPNPLLTLDGRALGRVEVGALPATVVLRGEFEAGERQLGVVYDNDGWDPDAGEDRNLGLDRLEVTWASSEGPLPQVRLAGPEEVAPGQAFLLSAGCAFGVGALAYRFEPGSGGAWGPEPEVQLTLPDPGDHLLRAWVRDEVGRVAVDGYRVRARAPGADAGDGPLRLRSPRPRGRARVAVAPGSRWAPCRRGDGQRGAG